MCELLSVCRVKEPQNYNRRSCSVGFSVCSAVLKISVVELLQEGVMEITDVRIFPRGEAKLKAFASITFDDSFRVKGLRVVEGSNGLFVAMPSRKLPDGTFEDIAHPLTREAKALIEKRVLAEYKKAIKE